MKVVYLDIVRKIGDAINLAIRDNRTIDYIELTRDEFYEFKSELRAMGGMFMPLYDVSPEVLYRGVKIIMA